MLGEKGGGYRRHGQKVAAVLDTRPFTDGSLSKENSNTYARWGNGWRHGEMSGKRTDLLVQTRPTWPTGTACVFSRWEFAESASPMLERGPCRFRDTLPP